MQCGSDTLVHFPRRISGADKIKVGARTEIGANPLIAAVTEYAGQHFSPTIEIGDDVYIGPNLYMVSVSSIKIGTGAVLSEHVFISDVSHGCTPEAGLIMQQPLVPGGSISIGEHTFVGFRASIMPGVSIGRNCIVGANSVVTKSVPDYCLIVGNPARVAKRYDAQKQTWVRVHLPETDAACDRLEHGPDGKISL
jgi:acetyltransferase-like isoleucine patch superfamily enzyme